MDNGFITLHRKITEWEWYDDINTFRVFLHLLLTANWKDTKWHGVKILRGQRIISYSKLAKEVRLSCQQARTALDRLKSTGEITSKSTNKYTVVTLVNYNKYQDKITNEQQATQQTNNKQITNKQQQLNKDNNNNKETSNNKPPIIPLENFSPLLTEKIQDWLTYKKERNQNYKQTGLKSLLAQIKKNADKYGDEAVAEVITSSMASNYQGIVFDKIKQQARGQPPKDDFMDKLKRVREKRKEQGQVIDI